MDKLEALDILPEMITKFKKELGDYINRDEFLPKNVVEEHRKYFAAIASELKPQKDSVKWWDSLINAYLLLSNLLHNYEKYRDKKAAVDALLTPLMGYYLDIEKGMKDLGNLIKS